MLYVLYIQRILYSASTMQNIIRTFCSTTNRVDIKTHLIYWPLKQNGVNDLKFPKKLQQLIYELEKETLVFYLSLVFIAWFNIN